MTIPDYLQEISDFRSPNGHPNEADFVAEGLTTTDPATGDLIWNVAGQTLINELISSRFSRALDLYDFILDIESKLPNPEIARQLVAGGYYAMFWAGRAVSLTLCSRDWGMGRGNHGNLPTHLKINTLSDSWFPKFHTTLVEWRALRNCADYNLFTVLVYSGRHAGSRPPKVVSSYINLDKAARDVGNTVEAYLQQSQRLITSRGVYLVRTI
jgi:hypothetical protein